MNDGNLGRILLAAVGVAAALVFGGPGLAQAADVAPSGCYIVVDREGIDVTVAPAGQGDGYFSLEREVFDRYWWRGRGRGGGHRDTSLVRDELPPTWAAAVDYRVRRDGVGAPVDCSLVDSLDLSCSMVATVDGFKVSWRYDRAEPGIDAVIRRQVTPGSDYYWRGGNHSDVIRRLRQSDRPGRLPSLRPAGPSDRGRSNLPLDSAARRPPPARLPVRRMRPQRGSSSPPRRYPSLVTDYPPYG